jgi:hypothetical protein
MGTDVLTTTPEARTVPRSYYALRIATRKREVDQLRLAVKGAFPLTGLVGDRY